MKKFAICSLLIAICGIANAAGPAPFSGYGNIQNVQNYSSNPFWNPNSPYNARVMPIPVYAQGADLNGGECQTVAAQIVAYQCSLRNGCAGAKLMDIKPAAMVQLSQLPGANYVGACGGFIDSAFNDYVALNPTAPTVIQQPQSSTSNNDFKIENPYKIKAPSGAKTQREQELERLQSQNGGGAGANNLVKSTFPTIASDLSFSDRMANAAAGYEQWRCDPKTGVGCAYQQLSIESDEKARERAEAQAESAKKIAEAQKAERCARNPNLPECRTTVVKGTAAAATKPYVNTTSAKLVDTTAGDTGVIVIDLTK